MGLVRSGYMDRMRNDTGQRVRPLTSRGRFRVFRTCVLSRSFSRISDLCMETHNFGFVSAELHPRLFTPCLACVYHYLEFASISRDQTQIVNVENSPSDDPPDHPIMCDGSSGELQFQLVNQVSHKNPKKSRT